MKYSLIACILLIFFFNGILDSRSEDSYKKSDANSRVLLWKDDFNDPTSLDRYWSSQPGFVRAESEEWNTVDKSNVFIEDGLLIIEARKETTINPFYVPISSYWKNSRKEAYYSSASISTFNKISVQYGRISARIRLPKGKGLWPAFWMLGSNRYKNGWPYCGEIDIIEHISNRLPLHIFGSIHFADENNKHDSKSNKYFITENIYNNFHEYSVEWRPHEISYLFDNKIYSKIKLNASNFESIKHNPFQQPFFLLLTLMVGSNASPIDDEDLPGRVEVDWIAVEKLSDGYGSVIINSNNVVNKAPLLITQQSFYPGDRSRVVINVAGTHDPENELEFVIVDFGDGVKQSHVNPKYLFKHKYQKDGHYKIKVTAVDDHHQITSKEHSVYISSVRK